MNQLSDCPECLRLADQYHAAVLHLAHLSERLAGLAGKGAGDRFKALLAQSKSAKTKCEHLKAEKERHLAGHV